MDTAKLTLGKVTLDSAEPATKAAFQAVQKSMGIIPNMNANMANLPGALETYLTGYKLFRGEGGFTPAEQETVFLTISRENRCEYCMAAHSMVAEKMSGVPGPVLEALRTGETVPDAKLRALSEFTRAMVASRGRPARKDLEMFLAAGFDERHVVAVILAVAVKTISNYSNHLFRTDVDPMFAAYRWESNTAA